MSQYCAKLLSICDCASLSTVDLSCVGKKHVKKGTFSMMHILYVTGPLRLTACTRSGNDDGTFERSSGLVRKHFNRADRRGCCTVRITYIIEISVSIFHDVLLHLFVDIADVWTEQVQFYRVRRTDELCAGRTAKSVPGDERLADSRKTFVTLHSRWTTGPARALTCFRKLHF